MKEFRVYVCPLYKIRDISHRTTIDKWNGQAELCEDALRFIDVAEQSGWVYSLRGFQQEFNNQDLCDPNFRIFITNKY